MTSPLLSIRICNILHDKKLDLIKDIKIKQAWKHYNHKKIWVEKMRSFPGENRRSGKIYNAC